MDALSLIGIFVIYETTRLLLLFMWWLLQVIANWTIYRKAGEAGWKSIIPFYGDYISYKIAWKGSVYWLLLLAIAGCYVSACFITAADGSVNMAAYALAMSALLFAAVIHIIKMMKKARAFGKGTLFGLGLVVLTPIFNLILGFGRSTYKGPC